MAGVSSFCLFPKSVDHISEARGGWIVKIIKAGVPKWHPTPRNQIWLVGAFQGDWQGCSDRVGVGQSLTLQAMR